MNNSYNLIEVIKVLLRWKMKIILFVIVASVSSVIVALVMPEYYESKSLLYPTNPSITDRQTLFSKESSNNFIDYFGTKSDVNRLMTIANSSGIVDFIINHYKLYQHYDIDTTEKYWRYKVKREFNSNYAVLKTEFAAIEVMVMDQDPKLAAEMTNMIVAKMDEHNKRVITNNKQKILKVFEQKVDEKQIEVNTLTDTLASLQSNYSITQIVTSDGQGVIVSGDNPKIVETYKVLQKKHSSAIEDLNSISTLRDQYDASARENVSSIYVVEPAYPALRKVKPIRWLICVSTTLIASFLGILGALLFDRIAALREELSHAS